MYFPVFSVGRKIRDSENTNGHAWLCATRCMQLLGGGGGLRVHLGVICGSYVGRRLKNNNEHAILTNCSLGVDMR